VFCVLVVAAVSLLLQIVPAGTFVVCECMMSTSAKQVLLA
jgi:hypothetical protein